MKLPPQISHLLLLVHLVKSCFTLVIHDSCAILLFLLIFMLVTKTQGFQLVMVKLWKYLGLGLKFSSMSAEL